MPGKCSFNLNWLKYPAFEKWIASDKDKSKARCKFCQKCFDISNMGEAALTSHARSKKHNRNEKLLDDSSRLNVKTFFQASTSKQKIEPDPIEKSSSNVLEVSVSGNDVLSSEILCALRVITTHSSYNSCNDINLYYQRLFHDSAIAQKFTCGSKKCAYLCCFGIAPYFKSLIIQKAKQQNAFVLLYDETLNQKLQLKQMDYYIRIWDGDKVETKYLDSSFLGHATAEDMLEKLNNSSGINGLPMSNILQLSMDGPNVNWKFFDLFQEQLKSNYECKTLNIGSCGLHIVNNAFKVGCESSDWMVKKLLSSLYFHFHNSPARRDNFIKLTNSTIFPLQFCATRWVENVNVAERALTMWSDVLVYVKAVRSGKFKDSKNKSFEILNECANDLLMPAKITCFQSIASIFQPFLLKFQTDKPMLPFLSEDLLTLLKNLCVRFIKPEVLSKCLKISNYLNLDIKDTANHLDYSKVDVGFTANKMLKSLKNSKKISDRQFMEFKMEAKNFLLESTLKLVEKCPLRHIIVRDISCLNPKNMKNKDACKSSMKNILQVLVENKKISEHLCNSILYQFSEFLDEVQCVSELANFNVENDRIDSILFNVCKNESRYRDLWRVFELLLLLSHGQASVERGFSVNRQIEVENLNEESIVSQRIICDYVKSVGGIFNVDISKELLLSASSARQKYMNYLDDKKKQESSDMNKKRKDVLNDDIVRIKKHRKTLENDISELFKSADEFAEKAEKSRNISFIIKSNSFRKSAKEKQDKLKTIDSELDNKLMELKSI